jgi:hypothetical protein
MVFIDVVDGRIQGSNLVSYASLREMCRFLEDNINILPSRSPAGIELTPHSKDYDVSTSFRKVNSDHLLFGMHFEDF